MADITVQSDSPFDAIRKFRDNGSEFWNARELMPLLGYKTWQKFSDAINRAIAACENAQNQVSEHFLPTSVNIKLVGRPQENYELSRFSCYLIAMKTGVTIMANIVILLAAIAAYYVIKSLCNGVRIMRYHELQARRSCMSLQELREDLNRQYYAQNMKETYDRNEL